MAQPNIIFIHVDEMRFPMHLPANAPTPDAFLAKYMPNLYSLWTKGVKFKRYFTAAADCTPGRGTFVTGLYAYQTGLFLTRESTSNPYATKQPQPALHPDFPTYGKVLREARPGFTPYETPYIGKWHLSNSPEGPNDQGATTYLEEYGFKGLTTPDPLGMPSQGLGLAKPQYPGGPAPIGDAEIAEQAVQWLYDRSKRTGTQPPFCLSVGFVNPHDKQFFWGGTQANQFNAVYNQIPDSKSLTGFEIPAMGFSNVIAPPLPPSIYKPGEVTDWNWQSSAALASKPKLQSVFKNMFSYFWTGHISENSADQQFGSVPSSYAPGKHDAVAPHSYWYRALDFYTQMMSAVDIKVGHVLHNIPTNLLSNTVIVFSADHGEYASSHGLQGKGGTVYNECFNVPLVVYDARPNPITQDINVVREQLVSSVDLLRMLVTIGHNGSVDWMENPDYKQMWGGNLRANLYGMLQSNATAGRPYVVYSTDEFFKLSPDINDDAPQHVIGCYMDPASGQQWGKLGLYHHWKPNTTEWNVDRPSQWEHYSYASGDTKEMNNIATSEAEKKFLVDTAVAQQLNLAVPGRYQAAQTAAINGYWAYVEGADFPHVSTAFS